jgi:hypothetical protein
MYYLREHLTKMEEVASFFLNKRSFTNVLSKSLKEKPHEEGWNEVVSFRKGKNKKSKAKFENGPFEGRICSGCPLRYLVHIFKKGFYFPKTEYSKRTLEGCINYLRQNPQIE